MMLDLPPVTATLDLVRDGQTVIIRPHIESPALAELRYRLDVAKHGVSGSSRISQQGAATQNNSVRLSVPAGEQCQATLQVLYQGKTIKEVQERCAD